MDSSILEGKKILITGNTGFTGSWASIWLQKIGARLAGYSLRPETSPSLFEAANLGPLLEQHEEGDISDYEKLLETFEKFRPELVLHLAAQPLVRRGYREPRRTFITNVTGTANVLEAATRTGVKGVVAITTDKVYSDSTSPVSYDEESPLWGIDPYSSSKVGSELVIGTYQRLRELETWRPRIVSVRGGNIIGGGDWSEDRLVPDAVRAWREGRTLHVRNPFHTRPWQHVIELVEAYIRLLSNFSAGYEIKNNSYNVGPAAGLSTSVETLVNQLSDSLGFEWQASKSTITAPETPNLSIDSQRIHQDLGWISSWDQTKTIEKTVDFYSRFYRGENALELCREQIQEWELGRESRES